MTRQTRRVVWIIIGLLALAALAGGYAWYRSYVAAQLGLALNNWILARTAEGYRIDADITPEPGDLVTVSRRLRNVAIVAPGGDWNLGVPQLDVSVGTFTPSSVDFHPRGRLELHYTVADQDFVLANEFAEADAGFTYDTAGAVIAAYITQSRSRFDGALGADIGTFRAEAFFDPQSGPASDSKTVKLKLSFDEAVIRMNLPLDNSIKHAETEAYVTGMLKPGRPSESLAAWRDGGGVLQIQRFVADWGPLSITGEGTLALDAQMQPLFAGTATVRGYNEVIDALAQAGMLERGQVTGAKIALAAMSKPAEDGGPPAAKLPITIQDGYLFVGPLTLAQMPRLVWQ